MTDLKEQTVEDLAGINLIHECSSLLSVCQDIGAVAYCLYIDGIIISILKGKTEKVYLTPGNHTITIKVIVPILKWTITFVSTRTINVPPLGTSICFGNKERIWNLLFDLDLLLCIIGFIVDIPSPWNIVYEVMSNGFFIIWIIHLWHIKDNYFYIKTK